MQITQPKDEDLIALTGRQLFTVWTGLCKVIESKYDMERQWNKGGKAWKYEYKYRRGGKTLCALYARENCIGFMMIFGKTEREKFESERNQYSSETQKVYDSATVYHDGKWVMFKPVDTTLFCDMEKLLLLKRKPNKK